MVSFCSPDEGESAEKVCIKNSLFTRERKNSFQRNLRIRFHPRISINISEARKTINRKMLGNNFVSFAFDSKEIRAFNIPELFSLQINQMGFRRKNLIKF